MRWSVLAQGDAVVGPHVDHMSRAQRGEPDTRAHVVRERQEGRAERHHAPVVRHSGEDGGHRVLADVEMDVRCRVPAHPAVRSLGLRGLTVLLYCRVMYVPYVLNTFSSGRLEIIR